VAAFAAVKPSAIATPVASFRGAGRADAVFVAVSAKLPPTAVPAATESTAADEVAGAAVI